VLLSIEVADIFPRGRASLAGAHAGHLSLAQLKAIR
jgi:hypothetical protein